MTKVSKKNKIIIGVIAVVVVLIAGVLIADNAIRSQKQTESVKREAKRIVSTYSSTVVYNSLKVPSDEQITGMLPMDGVETIKSLKTSGEPSTDTAVLKTAEKCDGSTSKTGAAVRILLPDKTEYCVD